MIGAQYRGRSQIIGHWRETTYFQRRKGCYYEADLILCFSSNDIISQQHRICGSNGGAGCVWTERSVCGSDADPALCSVLCFSPVAGSFAKCEKARKRLTVQARKIKIVITVQSQGNLRKNLEPSLLERNDFCVNFFGESQI